MAELSREFWVVAFFLSKYGNRIQGKRTAPPIELNTREWKEVYKLFYKKFGAEKSMKTFQNSLKNCRDAYDAHTITSGRRGWRSHDGKPVILQSLSKSVFNQYSSINREKIWEEISNLISDSGENNQLVKGKSNYLFNSRSSKNPSWIREELVLALDLYFRLDYGQMHGRNPEIIGLSKSLQQLNLVKDISDKSNFRSTSSVALKLANFKKLDQNFSGKGMRAGAKHDREIWNEFHKHINTLKKEADLIRQLYLKPKSAKNSVAAEPKVAYKSEFLFQYHKNRETDPLVMKVKKELVLAETKKLKCEVCGFDSLAFYGEIGNDLMEIHYNKELKNEPGLESSDMKDFVVVCSNCHKALDKNFALLDAADLKKLIRKKIK